MENEKVEREMLELLKGRSRGRKQELNRDMLELTRGGIGRNNTQEIWINSLELSPLSPCTAR